MRLLALPRALTTARSTRPVAVAAVAVVVAVAVAVAGLVIGLVPVPSGTPGANAPAAQAASRAPRVAVPAAGRPVRAKATRYVGHGTKKSCTAAAVVKAVAKGGVVKFRCGKGKVTIRMTRTAKVVNTRKRVVIDGGGRVTLDGLGKHRILYLNACDKRQVWTTSHCWDQPDPQLVVQNITLKRGYDGADSYEYGGGGAIFARGGQLKVVNTRFAGNRCKTTGPDVGGAAIRALDQYRDRPVYVVASTFTGGRCSNGSALSSIGTSWRVLNSVFSGNQAIGRGANPAQPGTPGGGSGGAIYLDGNTFTLELAGTTITDNVANEGGGAVFFVSNDLTGTMTVRSSLLTRNPSRKFENYPGIFFLGRRPPAFSRSTVR